MSILNSYYYVEIDKQIVVYTNNNLIKSNINIKIDILRLKI